MSYGVVHFMMTRFFLPHIPNWILFSPFEVLRVHLQAGTIPASHSRSLVQAARYLIETEGLAGLFRGNSSRVLYSISRFMCVVPLELIFMSLRPLMHRLHISPRHSLLIPVLLTLTLNQGYTYPLTFIRNEMILRKRSGWSVVCHTLREEGCLGFFHGLEGTYLGVIPSILAFNFINRALFYSREEYDAIIRPLNLRLPPGHGLDPLPLEAPVLDQAALESDEEEENEDDEWPGLREEESEESSQGEEEWDLEEADGDEEFDDVLNEIERELEVMEDALTEDDVLLQIEITLAAMQWKHWRPFCKLAFRAFITRSCSKLVMKLLCHPGDVLGKIMQSEHVSLMEATTSLWRGQGVAGFFRGVAIEFILTPLQVAVEMTVTILALRYQWGMRLFDFMSGSVEEDDEVHLFMEEDFGDRPAPGEQ